MTENFTLSDKIPAFRNVHTKCEKEIAREYCKKYFKLNSAIYQKDQELKHGYTPLIIPESPSLN